MKTDHDDVAVKASTDNGAGAVTGKAAATAATQPAPTEDPTAPATEEQPTAAADGPADGPADADAPADEPAKPGDTDAGGVDEPAKAEDTDAGVDEPAPATDAPAKAEDTPTAASAEDAPAADAPAGDLMAQGGSAEAAPPSAGPPAAGGTSTGGFWPPRTTKARVLLAAVLVLILGLGAGGYWWFAKRLPDGIAFRVDGVNVSDRELEEQVQTLGALYGVKAPTEQPRLDNFRRDVAKSTAVAMVVDNAAAERKVAVADRQVSDFLARYVTQYYGEGQAGRDAFVKDLADKGTSEPKVLAELKRQMTLKELFTQVTADIKVSDQDVRQTFDQRKDEFATPERREIHNIVLKTSQDADAALNELKAGGNFEALATQRSLDGSTKANGGNIGLVAARELDKPYADAAFGTPVGGIFGPVQTQYGFNVGKVVGSQPGAPADFDKIKEGVRRLVLTERADDRWRDYLTEKIKGAKVVYSDTYRPADPDSLPPRDGGQGGGQGGGQPAPEQPAPAPAPNAPPN